MSIPELDRKCRLGGVTEYLWDISNHDWRRHPVNLAEARSHGIAGVTHKATEGDWYRDPYYRSYARQLPGANFPVAGSYHVLNHGIDVGRQTDYWIDYVDDQSPNWHQHPCWIWQIDAEPLDGYREPTLAEIVACGQRIENRLGVDPARILVYAPWWVYYDELVGLPYRLWASSYGDNPAVPYLDAYPGDVDAEWHSYSGQVPLILQFGSRTIIGSQPTCDANAVRVADEDALADLFAPDVRPTPATRANGRNPDMIVVRVAEDTVPAGKPWPGWFTWDGKNLTHITATQGKTSNATQLTAACGQAAPAAITYAQYQLFAAADAAP